VGILEVGTCVPFEREHSVPVECVVINPACDAIISI